MKREEISEMAVRITAMARERGWNRECVSLASTGSVYIELTRDCGDKKEWVVIRVADHKKVYGCWMTMYSCSPYELDENMVADILEGEAGKVGDLL